MADDEPQITPEVFATWLTPQAALQRLPDLPRGHAAMAILERLKSGLIRAATQSIARNDEAAHSGPYRLSREVWDGAGDYFSNNSLWRNDDITFTKYELAQHQNITMTCYSVRFDPAGFDAWMPQNRGQVPVSEPLPVSVSKTESSDVAPAAPTAPVNRGGRPKKEWWDDLWVEMCRQIYEGDLQPKKQVDIEKAMADWAIQQGHEASDNLFRPKARLLFAALTKKDNN